MSYRRAILRIELNFCSRPWQMKFPLATASAGMFCFSAGQSKDPETAAPPQNKVKLSNVAERG